MLIRQQLVTYPLCRNRPEIQQFPGYRYIIYLIFTANDIDNSSMNPIKTLKHLELIINSGHLIGKSIVQVIPIFIRSGQRKRSGIECKCLFTKENTDQCCQTAAQRMPRL